MNKINFFITYVKIILLTLFFIFTCTQEVYAQHTVSGVVKDAISKEPIPGVNVLVEGTIKGTVTDLNGFFSIDVGEKDSILQFSFLGMKTTRVPINGKFKLELFLEEDNKLIDEVVLTALGIKRKEKALGYAVQKVKGEDAQVSGNPNPISGLQGKVAGIQVVQSSGTPGSSSKVLIRGNATFGNNQPLIVIDGVPIDNSTTTSFSNNVGGVDQSNRAIDINPDDIESVSVLKGAAATSLYGSRAGNGVILYTTKKGSYGSGNKMVGHFTSDITFSEPVNLHKRQNLYGQSGPGSSLSWGELVDEKDKVDVLKDFFKTGVNQNYSLSLSGGTKTSNVRFSVGYTDAKGIIPHSSWSRLSTRLTASTKLTDALTINGTVNVINSGGNRPQKGSNLSGVMLALYRNPINYDPRAAYYDDPVTAGTNTNYTKWYDNPYFSAENNTYKDDVWRVIGNATLTYDFLKILKERKRKEITNLTLMYRSGIDTYSDTRKGEISIGSNTVSDRRGMIVDYNGIFYEWNNDYIANVGLQPSENLSLDMLLGYNIRTMKDEYNMNTGTSLTEEGFYNIANAQSVVASQYTTLVNEYAGYVDLSLGLKNTYYFGVSGRNEWSSNFSQDRNSNFYPSANASFVFSELIDGENSPLSFGKFRASIGKTGIAPRPWRYSTYTTDISVKDGYTSGNSTDASGGFLTNFSQIKGNSDLKPEIQIGTEFGFDIRLWDGKLGLDFSVYNQQISDLLIEVPVSAATGFNYEYQNIGEMENKGFELSISSDLVKKKDVSWNMIFNYGYNRNKVKNLNLTTEENDRISLGGGFSSVTAYAAEGESFGILYGTDWEKDDQGNLLVDEDGYYIVTSERTKIADPTPDFTLGLKNTFTYKNFTLSVYFDGSFGGDIFNGTKSMMNYRGIGIDTEDREGSVVLKGVHADGTVNTTEISKENYWKYIEGIASASTNKIERDINYVKLRQLGLSYRLPLKNTSKLNGLTFSLIGTNLITITNYSDGDPETSLTGAGSNTNGFDYFNSPNVRSFIVKVSAKF